VYDIHLIQTMSREPGRTSIIEDNNYPLHRRECSVNYGLVEEEKLQERSPCIAPDDFHGDFSESLLSQPQQTIAVRNFGAIREKDKSERDDHHPQQLNITEISEGTFPVDLATDFDELATNHPNEKSERLVVTVNFDKDQSRLSPEGLISIDNAIKSGKDSISIEKCHSLLSNRMGDSSVLGLIQNPSDEDIRSPLEHETRCDETIILEKTVFNNSSKKLKAEVDNSTLQYSESRLHIPIKGILRNTNPQKILEIRPQLKSVSFADENSSHAISTECIITVPPNHLRRPVRRINQSFPTAFFKPSRGCKNAGMKQICKSDKMLRVLVLVMDPRSKQYELTSLQFESQVPVQLGSLLKLIRKATTHKPLKSQRHAGFCRPSDGREMINRLTVQDNYVKEDELLIAIPKGFSGSECANLSKPILNDSAFNRIVNRLRRNRIKKRKGELKAKRARVTKGLSMSKGRRELWVSNFFIFFPLLLLIWTFLSLVLQKDGNRFLFNDVGFQKLVNTLVDDIDTNLQGT